MKRWNYGIILGAIILVFLISFGITAFLVWWGCEIFNFPFSWNLATWVWAFISWLNLPNVKSK